MIYLLGFLALDLVCTAVFVLIWAAIVLKEWLEDRRKRSMLRNLEVIYALPLVRERILR